MSGAGGGELAWVVWRKRDTVDVLREGLTAQHHLLLVPVPHGQHVIRSASDARQQRATTIKVHTAVCLTRASCLTQEYKHVHFGSFSIINILLSESIQCVAQVRNKTLGDMLLYENKQ